ncbi:choice-of-anchor I family protein [Hydrogenophaga sp.]|uniref:choice-of-anchor I family protein n=1 Tax=Hydrogenophaga sp. TaxID=1904254 RepID=UPI0027282FC8|nr:choice-of-anchor I family protein [Hydrogenophaga sp.]MDO8906474.1 choice-of-anchor I family protein [Hydrogenophaga sp.]
MKNTLTPSRTRLFTASLVAAAALVACGGGETPPPQEGKATPVGVMLEKIGGYSSGVFGESAAEIPAFDAATQRAFVVNAAAGKIDVLDLSDPTRPEKIGEIATDSILPGSVVNSVAVHDGLVAVAIQASTKTDNGRVALYRARDLKLISHVEVGALPDMLVFTPDGKTLLVANEGEPSDDYQIDPEGSISVIDVKQPAKPTVRTAGFAAFNGQETTLRAQGVRIFGPGASAAQDFEPEYIAVSADGKTAWVALQENNAFAILDIKKAEVQRIVALGHKDHGLKGNEIDASDTDLKADIRTWPGVRGMYMPDAIAAYSVGKQNYIVSANEGDARAWGETNKAYWNGDASLGFVEEFRVKHLINRNGWGGRAGDDLPPQLNALAAGGLLNPSTFAYCGAVAGNPGDCRADNNLGRLTITWTEGYRRDTMGNPILFNASGLQDPAGNRLMYDHLYAYGGRSISIWNEKGEQVWDSGADIEKFLASDECMAGAKRNIPCKTFFNSNHVAGSSLDNRSDNKGPEPEGVAIGTIGKKTFAFVGLERMGGVLVYDITNPKAPVRMDYLNTREDWTTANPSTVLDSVGDLGPEGLTFIPANDSPNGRPLLLVGNEVSGTTAVLQLKLTF